MGYRFSIDAVGYDSRRSNSYELAAKKAFELCRKHECEVTISDGRGIHETFVFESGEVRPKY